MSSQNDCHFMGKRVGIVFLNGSWCDPDLIFQIIYLLVSVLKLNLIETSDASQCKPCFIIASIFENVKMEQNSRRVYWQTILSICRILDNRILHFCIVISWTASDASHKSHHLIAILIKRWTTWIIMIKSTNSSLVAMKQQANVENVFSEKSGMSFTCFGFSIQFFRHREK